MIGLFNKLLPLHLSANVWISLAMGKRFQLISVNLICASLCRNISREMPLFHSFTGCDTISCFTARATERNPLGKLGSRIVRLQMCSFILLIRTHITSRTRRTATSSCFTVVLYDKTSNGTSVNEARKEMLIKKNRTLENIPPTQVNVVIQ